MVRVVEKSTSVKYYVNKRNKNKYLEVHSDGYGHNTVVQFMRFASGVENKTGDRILHRWRVDNLSELLADYEECPDPRTNPRFDQNSEFMDYSINDGEGYIMSFSDYEEQFNNDPDLQYDFGTVDAYINAMLDNGDIKVFNDVSDEEYDHYFGESLNTDSKLYSFLKNQPEVEKIVRTSDDKFDVYENADHTTFIYHVEESPDGEYYIWNDEDGYDYGDYYGFDDFIYMYTGDYPVEESIKSEATDPKIRKQMSRDIWDLLWKYNNETNDDFYKDLKELGKKYANYKSTFYSIRKRILDKEMWYD